MPEITCALILIPYEPGKSILNSGVDELGFKKEVVYSSKNLANISLNEFLNQSMQKQVSKESEYWLKPNKKFF